MKVYVSLVTLVIDAQVLNAVHPLKSVSKLLFVTKFFTEGTIEYLYKSASIVLQAGATHCTCVSNLIFVISYLL